MTNKEKLIIAMEEDIDSKYCYNEIIQKMECENQTKNNLWRWSLVPIYLIVVISGILFLNNNVFFKNRTYVDRKNNVTLYINEINKKDGILKLDADVKTITSDLDFPWPCKEKISIPKDLIKVSKYVFYTRKNVNSQDYDLLYNYKISYYNENNRSINISYSKDYKPLRDYYFKEDSSKISKINGIELKIYKFENTYFTEFKFNGYNFDIETSKITKQELTNLLLSIIK